MASNEPYREVRGHTIDVGTVVVYRYDEANTVAAEEANEVVDEIKKANPHWEGPFLVMPATHSLESMPLPMAYALYEKLHAFFQKHGVPSADAPNGSADVDGGRSGIDLPRGDDGETVPDSADSGSARCEGVGDRAQSDCGDAPDDDRGSAEETVE